MNQRPVFVCKYRDGKTRTGTYAQTLTWFNEAQGTDNPCTVNLPDVPYKAP